jgi:hypothetical protein
MIAAGLENLTVDDLTNLKNHGVDPDFVKDMIRIRKVTVEQLVEMKNRGIDPELFKKIVGTDK